jgi:hypothetical protein
MTQILLIVLKNEKVSSKKIIVFRGYIIYVYTLYKNKHVHGVVLLGSKHKKRDPIILNW